MMKIIFTKHALEKFVVLKRHGVRVSEKQVHNTIATPKLVDTSRAPLTIFQSGFDSKRVLRVVCRRTGTAIIVITFYPGLKSQYEKK